MRAPETKRGAERPAEAGEREERPRLRRRQNPLLTAGITEVTYKDVQVLKYFVTEQGRIVPRRVTGVTSKQQRMIARAVKQARILGMLPFKKVD